MRTAAKQVELVAPAGAIPPPRSRRLCTGGVRQQPAIAGGCGLRSGGSPARGQRWRCAASRAAPHPRSGARAAQTPVQPSPHVATSEEAASAPLPARVRASNRARAPRAHEAHSQQRTRQHCTQRVLFQRGAQRHRMRARQCSALESSSIRCPHARRLRVRASHVRAPPSITRSSRRSAADSSGTLRRNGHSSLMSSERTAADSAHRRHAPSGCSLRSPHHFHATPIT
jgi:hypothetical protein